MNGSFKAGLFITLGVIVALILVGSISKALRLCRT